MSPWGAWPRGNRAGDWGFLTGRVYSVLLEAGIKHDGYNFIDCVFLFLGIDGTVIIERLYRSSLVPGPVEMEQGIPSR